MSIPFVCSMNSTDAVERLSPSLFCPIRHPLDALKYKAMLTDIEQLQFDSPCEYEG